MDVDGKVLKYENFLNERLRSDLKKVLDRRDAIYSDLAEYLQLKTIIEKLKGQQDDQKKEVKTLVDLGYFTLNEALGFIDQKTTQLMEQAQRLTDEASEISARVKLVMEALRELQLGSNPLPQQPPEVLW